MTAAQPSGSFSIISSSASFRNRIFQNRHPCLRKSPGRNRKYISFKRGCQEDFGFWQKMLGISRGMMPTVAFQRRQYLRIQQHPSDRISAQLHAQSSIIPAVLQKMGDPFRLGNILISEWIPQTQIQGKYPQHFSVIAVPVHAAVGRNFVVNTPRDTDSLPLGGLGFSAGRDEVVRAFPLS